MNEWVSRQTQVYMRLTGRVSILDRPLTLELRSQDASSNGQSELRDVYLITLLCLGVGDETVLVDKQELLGSKVLCTYYLKC